MGEGLPHRRIEELFIASEPGLGLGLLGLGIRTYPLKLVLERLLKRVILLLRLLHELGLLGQPPAVVTWR